MRNLSTSAIRMRRPAVARHLAGFYCSLECYSMRDIYEGRSKSS